MVKLVCEVCNKRCQDERGLSIHQRRCKGVCSDRSDILKMARRAVEEKRRREIQEAATQPLLQFDADMDAVNAALFDMPAELPSGSKRTRRLPKRFADHVPTSLNTGVLPTTSLPHLLDFAAPSQPSASPPGAASPAAEPVPEEILRIPLTTEPNDYGIFRSYPDKPTNEPDEHLNLDDFCASSYLSVPEKRSRQPIFPFKKEEDFAPFENKSRFLFACWANSENKAKTLDELNALVQGVLLHPDFRLTDMQGFNAKTENERLDRYRNNMEPKQQVNNGWKEGSVKLSLPAEDRKKRPGGESRAPTFEVRGIYYRPLLETIYDALDDSDAPPFHYTPYKEYWTLPGTLSKERIYGELYSTDAWLEAHEELQSLPREDGVENSVLPLMLYSDATHLANFGTASLWPLYMYLGGQSKYPRCKLSEPVCHHLAYIPSLPATVQDEYKSHFGRVASSDVLTFLKRELFHKVLSEVLFQPNFVNAYTNGILFNCPDKVTRRLFPRIMTYSADYPERMLIATLRNQGQYPCAGCLIEAKYIHQVGTRADEQRRQHVRLDSNRTRADVDKTRRWIYENGIAVNSKKIKDVLELGSHIPNKNAFSTLAPHGFNYHEMFVPDIMHEFELGVWKSIFTHLIRILVAEGGDTVSTLNSRFRSIPTFGRNTIRRFPLNTAAMQKLAARDFEYILKCSLPAFEDLLPRRHNTIVLDLLFILGTWHAYAKLRIHTETTLRGLKQSTKTLGSQVRLFKKVTCSAYETKELTKEVQARGRREAARVKKTSSAQVNSAGKNSAPKRKELNLNIPKLHALGKCAAKIERYGTTDSYTTQNGESQHRRVKRLYGRTNKRKFARDIAKLEDRVRKLRRIRNRATKNPSMSLSTTERLPKTPPEVHYHMSPSRKNTEHLPSWLEENQNDPALETFMEDLRQHVVNRLLHRDETTELSPDEINGLDIKDDKAYWHMTLRVNHTTYDIQRSLDSMNPRTHSDVMVLAPDEDSEHPYDYARIIGLFHLDVCYTGPGSYTRTYRKIDIAWIRWYQFDSTYTSGFHAKRLPRLQFVDYSDPSAFAFLDPDLIIRGSHLIPAFAYGKTDELLPPSISRRPEDGDEDYYYYYANIFVDRDIFMRYHGGGIGHKSTWHLNERLLRDSMNMQNENEEEGMIDEQPSEETLAVHDNNKRESESEEIESEGEEGESESGFETDNVEGGETGGESEGYGDL